MKKIRIWYEVIKVDEFPVIKSQIRLGDLVYVFDSVWWSGDGNKRHNIRGTLIREGLHIHYKTHCRTTIKPEKYVIADIKWLMKELKENSCMGDLEKELYEWLENYDRS